MMRLLDLREPIKANEWALIPSYSDFETFCRSIVPNALVFSRASWYSNRVSNRIRVVLRQNRIIHFMRERDSFFLFKILSRQAAPEVPSLPRGFLCVFVVSGSEKRFFGYRMVCRAFCNGFCRALLVQLFSNFIRTSPGNLPFSLCTTILMASAKVWTCWRPLVDWRLRTSVFHCCFFHIALPRELTFCILAQLLICWVVEEQHGFEFGSVTGSWTLIF